MEVSTGQYLVEDKEYFVTSIMPFSNTSFAGTVVPLANFDADTDAEALTVAMNHKDAKAFWTILCNRNNYQRQQIKRAYKSVHKNDLITDISKKVSGDYENLILSLLYTPAEYDARELNYAMKGMGTDDHILIEILCSRTNKEILHIQEVYFKEFKKQLVDDINSETKGQLNAVLNELLKAKRDENIYVNLHEAAVQADRLKTSEKDVWDNFFIKQATTETSTQLQAVFLEYEKLAKVDVETTVKKLFKGSVEECYLALVKIAKNSASYFSELLHASTKGLGTSDRQLIRITVSRSEKDLKLIREYFQKAFNKTLVSVIEDDTSGDYRDGLIALVKGNQ